MGIRSSKGTAVVVAIRSKVVDMDSLATVAEEEDILSRGMEGVMVEAMEVVMAAVRAMEGDMGGHQSSLMDWGLRGVQRWDWVVGCWVVRCWLMHLMGEAMGEEVMMVEGTVEGTVEEMEVEGIRIDVCIEVWRGLKNGRSGWYSCI